MNWLALFFKRESYNFFFPSFIATNMKQSLFHGFKTFLKTTSQKIAPYYPLLYVTHLGAHIFGSIWRWKRKEKETSSKIKSQKIPEKVLENKSPIVQNNANPPTTENSSTSSSNFILEKNPSKLKRIVFTGGPCAGKTSCMI